MSHSTNPIPQDNTPEFEESLRRGTEGASYSVTILETVPWPQGGLPLLTKTITRGTDGEPGVVDYDHTKWFKFHLRECADIEALLALLKALERQPHCAIVRGAPVVGLDLTQPQRRLLAAHADGTPSTLRDVERDLIGFDVDGAREIEGIDWRTHPREALDAAWKRDRPDWCRDVDFVAYFSSGQGFKPGLRYRVFLLLARPLTSASAKMAIKAENQRRKGSGRARFDDSLYSAATLHYTAAPVFRGGPADPLPAGRVFLIKGMHRRATPPVKAVEHVYCYGGVHGTAGVGASKSGRASGAAALPPVMTKAESLARGGPDSVYSPVINRILHASESGVDAFHNEVIRAATAWVIENGPWADPKPILKRLWSVLSRHARHREPGYAERQWISTADWIEELQARDRRRAESSEGHGTPNGESGGAAAVARAPMMKGGGS
jgi:hypothetical protein